MESSLSAAIRAMKRTASTGYLPTEDHDGGRAGIARRVVGGIGQDLRAFRYGLMGRILISLAANGILALRGDPRHEAHGLHGVLAHRGFGGEHDGIDRKSTRL